LIWAGHAQIRATTCTCDKPFTTNRRQSDSCLIRPRGKVQAVARFRPGSTGSVPFLYHVCRFARLFSNSFSADLEWKLNYEIASTNSKFSPPPGPTFGTAADPADPQRLSQVAGRQSLPAVLSSPITDHSPPPESIASFCHVFRGYTTLFLDPRNRHRCPLITTHQSLLTNHHFSPNSRYNCAFQRAAGQSNRKPSSAAGHRHPAQHETGFGLRSSNITAPISRTKKDNA